MKPGIQAVRVNTQATMVKGRHNGGGGEQGRWEASISVKREGMGSVFAGVRGTAKSPGPDGTAIHSPSGAPEGQDGRHWAGRRALQGENGQGRVRTAGDIRGRLRTTRVMFHDAITTRSKVDDFNSSQYWKCVF